MDRLLRVTLLGTLIYLGLLAPAALLEGCSDSTTGRRVRLHTRVELAPAAASRFDTAAGWQVTLDRVLLAAGPFYYFDGAPSLARRAPPARFDNPFGLALAHAHPGHYAYGNAMGEMLSAWSVELSPSGVELPDGAGVTGPYRSARFSLTLPPAGPLAEALEGQAVIAVGRAEQAGQATRYFRAVAGQSDLDALLVEGRIDGCPFTETEVQRDGTVTVVVDPRPWFSLVDFSALEPGAVAAPVELPPGSQPRLSFAQGLTAPTAYRFSYQEDAR